MYITVVVETITRIDFIGDTSTGNLSFTLSNIAADVYFKSIF